MNEPEDPRPPRPTAHPLFIEYQGPDPQSPNIKTGGKIMMGFLLWIGCLIIAVQVTFASQSLPIGLATLAALLLPSAIVLSRRSGWRGIVPGILIGMSLTCLMPIGIVWVACGGHF
jgi:hypothetical protein